MPELVYLNGEYLGFDEAKVSVEDRGFQFGDGVYEVVRCYGGRPFSLASHLERLYRSATAIDLEIPHSLEELLVLANGVIEKSGLAEGELYMQVSRGASPRQHYFPVGAAPTLVISIRQVRLVPGEYRVKGIGAITVPDDRWGRCHIKSVNLLPNVLAKEKARRSGAQEAVFVRADGLVSEGSSSNVFAVVAGVLITPPADHHILAGITRGHFLDLARREGVQVREEELPLDTLLRAEEVFITSTVMEMLPIVRLDGRQVGDGIPGPVSDRLYRLYRERYREETDPNEDKR
ncbi:hypothetical protein SY88_01665 [Clostridiales bacterium PH28_bin88]|nr:hypothetical protein SY88_01665 [Clostridiales bacterium PH28_bin88]